MPHKKEFTKEELFPKLRSIAQQRKCALVVGLVQKDDDGLNREAIWFLEKDGTLVGRLNKFALPKYDHVVTKGGGDIVPETDFSNRFKVFDLAGLRVSAMFCWEVYSDLLWTGLGLLKPDVVFSMIKFGPNSWPIVKKKNGRSMVVDFGYGSWTEEGGWIERLRVASKWQVKCPIVCSTNTWNLKSRSMPLCGTICEIPGQAEETLWHPTKEMKMKTIPEHIQVDTINPAAVQAVLQNKWKYKDVIGEFPPFDVGKFTMMLKMNRIEDRIISGKEQTVTDKATSNKGGFDI